MARTLFFIEAIAVIVAAGLLSALGGVAAAGPFVVPVLVSLTLPVAAASAVWPFRSVARAFRHAFQSGRPGAGAADSVAVLASLRGFVGLGAVGGSISAAILLLSGAVRGGDPRLLAPQSVAFALFGVLYAATARILGEVVEAARVPPGNGDARAGLGAFAAKYGLTAREAEVAGLLVEGASYQEIGERLFVSVPTVKTHVSRVYGKTGCPNKVALVLLLREDTGRIIPSDDGRPARP